MYTIDVTRKLARLSKLKFSNNDLSIIHSEMTEIIALMDMVKEFSSNNSYERDAKSYSNLREDICIDSFSPKDILANAKNVKNQAFIVSKLI